jgi:hypothetical protein
MSISKRVVALILGALVAASLSPVAAQTSGVTVKVVARRLNNPRGLDIGPSGGIYVAEAGKGGKKCITKEVCFGYTGSISRVYKGKQRRVRDGLLSVILGGSEVVGPDDVAVTKRGIFTILPSAGPKARSRISKRVARQSGAVLKLSSRHRRKVVSQIDRFEFRKNPDGGIIDSNPYGLEFAGRLRLAVDAGGNSLLRLRKNGKKRLVAVFPKRTIQGNKYDFVPTSVVRGPGGDYYVGQLGGGGTPPDQARVLRVTPSGQKSVYRAGFNMIMGIDFGPDGSLYVVELLRNGWSQFGSGDFTGALIKVEPNGDRTEIARGRVIAPGGVVAADNGTIYVSVNALFPGKGKILRIRQ